MERMLWECFWRLEYRSINGIEILVYLFDIKLSIKCKSKCKYL